VRAVVNLGNRFILMEHALEEKELRQEAIKGLRSVIRGQTAELKQIRLQLRVLTFAEARENQKGEAKAEVDAFVSNLRKGGLLEVIGTHAAEA